MPTVRVGLGDARMFPIWRAGWGEDRLQLLRLGDTLRLLIADDHETIRKGVRSIHHRRADAYSNRCIVWNRQTPLG